MSSNSGGICASGSDTCTSRKQYVCSFVIPMVFASLSAGAANIVLLGKVSTIGTRTALFFVLFSATAALLSLAVAMLLRILHKDGDYIPKTSQIAWFNVLCDNGKYLEMASSEDLNCSAPAMGDKTLFQLDDLEFALTESGTNTKITVAEQLSGILNSLFPKNIFISFVDGVLLSVITFSIAFGAAATRATSRENSPLLDVLNQMNKIFYFIITRVVDWSPLAVLSLVAGSLSTQSSMDQAVTHVGILVLCNFITVFLFELVFYPIVIFVLIRKNPFKYMRMMLPAATFSRSAARLRSRRCRSRFAASSVAARLDRCRADPERRACDGVLDLEHDLPERGRARDVQLPGRDLLVHRPHEHHVQRLGRHVRRAHHRRAGRRSLRDHAPGGRRGERPPPPVGS